MKMAAHIATAVLFVSCLQAASARDHPVEQVIRLLNGLMIKTEAEGKAEEVTYGKFQYWCKNSAKSLETAIAEEREAIDSLTSRVQSKKVEESVLTEQIDALDAELLRLSAADTAAFNVRSSQASLYSQADGDYTSTISAISDAITELERSENSTATLLLAQHKVKRALMLGETAVTERQRSLLSAFVRQDLENATNVTRNVTRPELRAEGDYEGHIKRYAFKSNSVIELLKELKIKFEEEQTAATRNETASINAYDLATAARLDLTNKATASKNTKGLALGDVQGELLSAEGELNSTRADLQADSATLERTEQTCAMKRTEWSERSETRSKELEAMDVAIKILSKVTGVRTEAPSNPVPPPSPVNFLQLEGADPTARAVQLLRTAARSSHSRALERLAEELSAHLAGPFDQVVNMIQKMIFRLMDEQKDEDKHKMWCDLELNKTEISRDDKADRMEDLRIKIESAEASVQRLTGEIASADSAAHEILGHVDEATEIREAGKAENKEALKDSQDAQAAISNAIAVLEAFYKDSGMVPKESWEFLQKGVTLPAEPSTWDASYTGVMDPQAQPSGIISVLKRISADFASMEAETRAQEESDQGSYEEDMKACDIEKARRVRESEEKTLEKKRLIDKIATMKASRKHTSDEHETVEQYLQDLQHACVDGDSTYENRTAARSEEIEALRQSEAILKTAFEANATTTPQSFLHRRFLRATAR